jgi:hypothetical protein
VIEVHGCRPGQFQLGEGDDMVCIDPFNGHDGGDGPGIGPGPGPTGGGTGPRHVRPSDPIRPVRTSQLVQVHQGGC